VLKASSRSSINSLAAITDSKNFKEGTKASMAELLASIGQQLGVKKVRFLYS